jgi:hypothetical protein
MLEVRLLGKFDVRFDDALVKIPSRSEQSLFAFLILHARAAFRREHFMPYPLWYCQKLIRRISSGLSSSMRWPATILMWPTQGGLRTLPGVILIHNLHPYLLKGYPLPKIAGDCSTLGKQSTNGWLKITACEGIK